VKAIILRARACNLLGPELWFKSLIAHWLNTLTHQCCCLQSSVTGASSGAQEDAMKAEAKVQDLQGRLKIAEQEKAAAEKAQKVRPYAPRSVYYKTHNCT